MAVSSTSKNTADAQAQVERPRRPLHELEHNHTNLVFGAVSGDLITLGGDFFITLREHVSSEKAASLVVDILGGHSENAFNHARLSPEEAHYGNPIRYIMGRDSQTRAIFSELEDAEISLVTIAADIEHAIRICCDVLEFDEEKSAKPRETTETRQERALRLLHASERASGKPLPGQFVSPLNVILRAIADGVSEENEEFQEAFLNNVDISTYSDLNSPELETTPTDGQKDEGGMDAGTKRVKQRASTKTTKIKTYSLSEEMGKAIAAAAKKNGMTASFFLEEVMAKDDSVAQELGHLVPEDRQAIP